MQEIVVPLDVRPGWTPAAEGPQDLRGPDELALWRLTVACSVDPCLVVDLEGCVVALSPGLARTLGRTVEACLGAPLVGGVLELLPFGGVDDGAAVYAERVPPVWSLRTSSPARSLVRVRRPDGPATFDVVATPLHGGAEGECRLLGALAFFSPLD